MIDEDEPILEKAIGYGVHPHQSYDMFLSRRYLKSKDWYQRRNQA